MSRVHLSVDDVIYSLMRLAERRPTSVFDIPLFGMLKALHDEYSALFTLYAFENYAESFFINEVPSVYWDQLAEAGFVRIGFHGTFAACDDATFDSKCRNFYSVLPVGLHPKTIRLHKYSADDARIDSLKGFGVKELLCRENESRMYGSFPTSYTLTEREEGLLDNGCFSKNGMSFRKTDIRLEFHDIPSLRMRIDQTMNRQVPDTAVIFTHEKRLDEAPLLFKNALEILNRYNPEYIF